MNKSIQNVQMTDKEWKALLYFLDEHSNCQANAGCNDLPGELEQLFTEKEGDKMAKEFAIYNNPENPDGPEWPLPDSCLLAYLEQKIQSQLKI